MIVGVVDEVELPEAVYTVPEVAAHLRFSIRKVRYLIASGDLASIKAGGSRRVKASQLAAYLNALEPTRKQEIVPAAAAPAAGGGLQK